MAANLSDLIDNLSMSSVEPQPPSQLALVSELDIEIIHSEILPRLPTKSLLRFKTVSKSFNAIISSPRFARLHFNRHHHSSNTRLLVTNGTKRTIDIYDLNFDSSALPIVTFKWESFITTSVVGSCNGLLLIRIHRDFERIRSLVLLNPTTRAYIEFPSTDINVIDGHLGLGFDEHSNDYKIVVITGMSTSMHYSNERVTRVYSVNSKSWKAVDRRSTIDSVENPFRTYNGVLVNNHLLHWRFEKRSNVEHDIWWFGDDEERKVSIISCFDVISETWQQDVLFPNFYYNYPRRKGNNNNVLDFGVLDGCLFSSFVNKVESLFDMWVMKEYGVQESWMKTLSINIGNDPNGRVVPIAEPFTRWRMIKPKCGSRNNLPFVRLHCGLIPVACRGTGQTEVLLMNRESGKKWNTLFWYNWKINSIVGPQILNFYGHQPFFVKESLVNLSDAKLFDDLYEQG